MNRRFAIFCPGQGGQHETMFSLAGSAVSPQLAAVIGSDSGAVTSDTSRLFANRFAQPLIVALGMAHWEQLREAIPMPSVIAGYSVGELTAYGVAGALSTAELITLAAERARMMDQCIDPAQPHAMVALSGLTDAAARAILAARGLYPALINGADRMVAGGLRSQCDGIEAQVAALGGSCQRLPLQVASHTPLLADARAGFGVALAACHWSDPARPVISGSTAQKISNAVDARTSLLNQLTSPVQWDSCMECCVENGIAVTLELGPGNALSRMMRARYPDIASRAVDEFRSIAAVIGWLRKELALP